jgi:hypothetical protein
MNDLKISQFKPDEASIDGNKIFIKYAVGAENRFDQNTSRKKIERNSNNSQLEYSHAIAKMYEER